MTRLLGCLTELLGTAVFCWLYGRALVYACTHGGLMLTALLHAGGLSRVAGVLAEAWRETGGGKP